jgi:hypothetical protein
MAAGCGFCGSMTGPFTTVEGLFPVELCARCQRGERAPANPYPALSRAELRAGLEQLPPWVLGQTAAANRQKIAETRERLARGEPVAFMYQAAGLAWLERQAEVAEAIVADRQARARSRRPPHHR